MGAISGLVAYVERKEIRRCLTWISILLLGFLSLAYAFIGARHVIITQKMSVDLRLRWIDQQYVFHRQNPYDACFADREGSIENYELRTGRNAQPIPHLGAPKDVGYPPWSFLPGAALYSLPWRFMRPYSAVVSLASLACLGWVFWTYGRDRLASAILALTPVACSGHAGSISIGQATVLVMAMLAGSLYFDRRGNKWLSGVLLGISLLKPTISGPFVFCLIFKKQWKSLAGCFAYLAVASGYTWWATHTNPLEMTLQMFKASARYLDFGRGPINVLISLLGNRQLASALMVSGSCIIVVLLMARIRKASLLDLFALAAVCGRFWTYHSSYDDVAIAFLALALGVAAFETRSRIWLLAFAIVGATLWMPSRLYRPPFEFVNTIRMIIWPIGALFLVWFPRKPMEAKKGSEALSSIESFEKQ